MEISHHRLRVLKASVLAESALKGELSPKTQPPIDIGVVQIPGIVMSGGINALLAPRDPDRDFEFRTRIEALNKGWPQDQHFAIERKRRIPLIVGFIANQLHRKMVNDSLARHVEAQQARF